MGFMDKVKSAAGDAATKAKEAAGQAQDKMEQAQTRKKIDEKKKELGGLIYEERTKGTPPGAQADSLVAEITALEESLAAAAAAEAGSAAATTPTDTPVSGTSAAPPPPSASSSDPAPGDFKL